jgi:hypothetical protein
MPDDMKEQQIGGAGNEAGVGVPANRETRELMRPKRRGLAGEGLIVDLVVKPVKAFPLSAPCISELL